MCRDLALKDIKEDAMGWTQNKGKTKGDSSKRAAAIAEERKKSAIAQQRRKGLVFGSRGHRGRDRHRDLKVR